MKQYDLYSAGTFVKGTRELVITNKFSQEDYAVTSLADEQLLDCTIDAALEAKQACREMSSMQRYDALMQIATDLRAQREHLATVLAAESGKPLVYARGEIDRGAQTFVIAAEESKRLPKEYMSLDWTANGKGKEGIVNYFPVGLVAGISPFNF